MSKRQDKSLKVNMILNTIKSITSILFPIITFPYLSNVLGVENIGKYNFANSVIGYFVLIAGLGINTYAIREGAKVRNNKELIEVFSNEMFSINMWSSIVAYILLLPVVFLVPRFRDCKLLLLILSIQIVSRTIGIEWLYSIYEDYVYITSITIIYT